MEVAWGHSRGPLEGSDMSGPQQLHLKHCSITLDDDDYLKYKDRAITSFKNGSTRIYHPGLRQHITLAVDILGLTPRGFFSALVINGDITDLRRENLRVVKKKDLKRLLGEKRKNSKNPAVAARVRNSVAGGTPASGYHGVSLHKPTGRYNVRFRIPGSTKKGSDSFGYYDTAEEAGRKYDELRVQYGFTPVNNLPPGEGQGDE